MLIRFFELLSSNRLEIWKMDIPEDLISPRSSGQKEILHLSKRMGENKKKKKREKENVNRIAYGSALVTRSNFYNRSHITLFASLWNFGKIIRQVLMRGIIARGPGIRGCDGKKSSSR